MLTARLRGCHRSRVVGTSWYAEDASKLLQKSRGIVKAMCEEGAGYHTLEAASRMLLQTFLTPSPVCNQAPREGLVVALVHTPGSSSGGVTMKRSA